MVCFHLSTQQEVLLTDDLYRMMKRFYPIGSGCKLFTMAFTLLTSQSNRTTEGRVLQHHHHNSKWRKIFWMNGVHHSSTDPESCRIDAKLQWSCFDGLWWLNTILIRLMLGFPLILISLLIYIISYISSILMSSNFYQIFLQLHSYFLSSLVSFNCVYSSDDIVSAVWPQPDRHYMLFSFTP